MCNKWLLGGLLVLGMVLFAGPVAAQNAPTTQMFGDAAVQIDELRLDPIWGTIGIITWCAALGICLASARVVAR